MKNNPVTPVDFVDFSFFKDYNKFMKSVQKGEIHEKYYQHQ